MAFSEALKVELRARARHKCCLCESHFVEIHHIVPQAEGGSDEEENAAPLCGGCHARYGNNPDHRKQIREARDQHYLRSANPEFSDLLHELTAGLASVERLKAEFPQKVAEYEEQIAFLTQSAQRISIIWYNQDQEKSRVRDMLDRLEMWPYDDKDARNYLTAATHDLLELILTGRERFVFYHLLKWNGDPIRAAPFWDFIEAQIEKVFPNPDAVNWGFWGRRVISDLRYKGLIRISPVEGRPDITIVRPFPYPRASIRPENVYSSLYEAKATPGIDGT